MTSEEAIKILENKKEYSERIIDNFLSHSRGEIKDANETIEMCDMAISALKEVQQYRGIGTVEEIKKAKACIKLLRRIKTLEGIMVECLEYEKIGTLEECREAVEKQKAKEPKLRYKPRLLGKATYTCPNCGNCRLEKFANERQQNNYCWDCGQKLDWDER